MRGILQHPAGEVRFAVAGDRGSSGHSVRVDRADAPAWSRSGPSGQSASTVHALEEDLRLGLPGVVLVQ